MIKGPVLHIVIIISLLIFQVAIGQNLILFNSAFCFVYILGLLMLPVDLNDVPALLIGFFVGISMDLFYNTGGMHIAAAVFVMFIRRHWLNLVTPQGGYDMGVSPSLEIGGIIWFVGYALPLIVVHHAVLFFLESYGFNAFWFTLKKVLFSSIFTFVLSWIFLILFKKSSR